ncbi:MAG: HlyD family efflux transporter periplasmic adaptor subunit [Sandaracinus sp.]
MSHARLAMVAMAVLAGVGALACSGSGTSAGPERPAPSHVEGAVAESSLATVHLSPEAAARLALRTATVTRAVVPSTRLVGGEVLVPPGRSVVLTAPVAGIVRFASGGDARVPGAPVPGAPVPGAPVPGARVPGAPVPGAPVPGAPVPGARVRAGEVLVHVAPITVIERDVRARAARDVAAARAALAPAQARVDRLTSLTEERATSARLVEEATAARDLAQADLSAAEARARATRAHPLVADVSITVRAPFDGVVRACTVVEGQGVAAGAALFELVAVEALEVRVPVYAGDLSRLDRSAAALVRPLGASADTTPLVATPLEGPPTADLLGGTVDRYYALAAESSLEVGERVLVELPLALEEAARSVPAGALVLDASGASWVYVCGTDEHSFVRTRIDPIRTAGDQVIFARGPAEGVCVLSEGAADVFGAEFPPGH